MNPADAIILTVAVAALMTAVGTAGWRWLKEEQRRAPTGPYVTIVTLEEALASQEQRHNAAMLGMQRRMDAAVVRQDSLEREVDDLREKRAADHAQLAAMQRRMEAWMEYARKLADIIRRELGMEPPPAPEEPPSPASGKPAVRDVAGLARRIGEQFSKEEIDGLAFDIGVEPESLGGVTRPARARELAATAERAGKLEELAKRVSELRPEGRGS
jgi:hypothetical protein